jgi:membrane-associated phospholipid phosphatase
MYLHSLHVLRENRRLRWKTFAIWASWVGVAFFSVYPVTNWLAESSARRYAFFLDAELAIPFVPQWVWFYLSLYALFALPPFFLDVVAMRRLGKALVSGTLLAGLCFVLFPAPIGYLRAVPEFEPYRTLFQSLFQVDAPFNTLPSLHVSCSAGILLALAERSRPPRRVLWFSWLILIVCSTVLVHQHHLLDVATGLALALFLHFFWRKRHA